MGKITQTRDQQFETDIMLAIFLSFFAGVALGKVLQYIQRASGKTKGSEE